MELNYPKGEVCPRTGRTCGLPWRRGCGRRGGRDDFGDFLGVGSGFSLGGFNCGDFEEEKGIDLDLKKGVIELGELVLCAVFLDGVF